MSEDSPFSGGEEVESRGRGGDGDGGDGDTGGVLVLSEICGDGFGPSGEGGGTQPVRFCYARRRRQLQRRRVKGVKGEVRSCAIPTFSEVVEVGVDEVMEVESVSTDSLFVNVAKGEVGFKGDGSVREGEGEGDCDVAVVVPAEEGGHIRRSLCIGQLNMAGSSVVAGELLHYAKMEGIDLLLVQEPYYNVSKITGEIDFGFGASVRVLSAGGDDIWATVVVINPEVEVLLLGQYCSEYGTCVRVAIYGVEFVVASIYFKYAEETAPILALLERISRRFGDGDLVIGMDTNGEAITWAPETEAFVKVAQGAKAKRIQRGALIDDALRGERLVVLNDVSQGPTYKTVHGESYIDVTVSSRSFSRRVRNWSVVGERVTSDHRFIKIMVDLGESVGEIGEHYKGEVVSGELRRFSLARASWSKFREDLEEKRKVLDGMRLRGRGDVDAFADRLVSVLVSACDESIPLRKQPKLRNRWWNRKLSVMKRKVYRARRAFQKEKREMKVAKEVARVAGVGMDVGALQKLRAHYLTMRMEYRKLVRRTKISNWIEFVEVEGNKEPWGKVYKTYAGKLKRGGVMQTVIGSDGVGTEGFCETAMGLLGKYIPGVEVLTERDGIDISGESREGEEREGGEGVGEEMDLEEFGERRAIGEEEEEEEVSLSEVRRALWKMKERGAPGMDRLEVGVLKKGFDVVGQDLVRLFQGCYAYGVFPASLKRGLMVLVPKLGEGGKVKGYRPICLLPILGKLFEAVIRNRLDEGQRVEEIVGTGGTARLTITGRQFGFTPGRSCDDAIVEMRSVVQGSECNYVMAILFDVKGAFDNVVWRLVLEELRGRGCGEEEIRLLEDYFSHRYVHLRFQGNREVIGRATKGCPQGSVLGPTLWNALFEGVLRELDVVEGATAIAYADDLVVLLEGNTRAELERVGREVVALVLDWCSRVHLELAVEKTEAVVLKRQVTRREPLPKAKGNTRRRTHHQVSMSSSRPPVVKLGGRGIKVQPQVKYLGVVIGECLRMLGHCAYLKAKVGQLIGRFQRLVRARGGLRFRAMMTIYRGVVEAILGYAAGAWWPLVKGKELKKLESAQLQALRVVTGSYRTVSYDGVCVLAGVLPVRFFLQERWAVYELKNGRTVQLLGKEISPVHGFRAEVREVVLDAWQNAWSQSDKGEVTRGFFPDVRERMRMDFIKPSYYVSQFLTGHGDFFEKLASFALADPNWLCECKGRDNSDHVLYECLTFEEEREDFEVVPMRGRWREDAKMMVENRERFQQLQGFATKVIRWRGRFRAALRRSAKRPVRGESVNRREEESVVNASEESD